MNKIENHSRERALSTDQSAQKSQSNFLNRKGSRERLSELSD